MRSTPRNMRLQIAILGRRNVGKSSLLNAITGQNVSIVSAEAGTTTDPVGKPMELLPLGPVLLVDTAGIDDVGALGALRIERTRAALDRADIGILVCGEDGWGELEEGLLGELREREVAVIVALNKADLAPSAEALAATLRARGVVAVCTTATTGAGIDELRQALIDAAPADYFESRRIVADLAGAGDLVVLVVPIDKEAPKGRLILPQVQTIRDLLDSDAFCLVVKERELEAALAQLTREPRLVVTDSQAFAAVAAVTPAGVPLTSFSILFARFQGDLPALAAGATAIDRLRTGDRVLIAEGCTHHPIADDIGTVKIPRWLRERTGVELEFSHVQGRDFPDDVSPFSLVVHCGHCMGNRREMLSRILRCRRAGVPITNYGVAIAYSLGILERALAPFPAALAALRTGTAPS